MVAADPLSNRNTLTRVMAPRYAHYKSRITRPQPRATKYTAETTHDTPNNHRKLAARQAGDRKIGSIMPENPPDESDQTTSAPAEPDTDHDRQGPSSHGTNTPMNYAASIPPEHMTLAALAAGSSESIGQGIATAGALGMAQGEADYQRRWAKRVREAHGWKKLWRIIWG